MTENNLFKQLPTLFKFNTVVNDSKNLKNWSATSTLDKCKGVFNASLIANLLKQNLGIDDLKDPDNENDILDTPYKTEKLNDEFSISMFVGYNDSWRSLVLNKMNSLGTNVIHEKDLDDDAWLYLKIIGEENFAIFKFYFWNTK